MSHIIEVECPICRGNLWIDTNEGSVIQHKKSQKKNTASLDELLIKEKEKKEKVDEKFLSAQELEKAKKRKAEEIFNRSMNKKTKPQE